VGLREIQRRLGNAFGAIRRAATEEIGEDLGELERASATAWAFAYLLGGELAHLVYLTENPVVTEAWINEAMSVRMREYADSLEARAPRRAVGDDLRRIRDIAARLAGRGRARRRRLVLVE
jgi:hypothetical protein